MKLLNGQSRSPCQSLSKLTQSRQSNVPYSGKSKLQRSPSLKRQSSQSALESSTAGILKAGLALPKRLSKPSTILRSCTIKEDEVRDLVGRVLRLQLSHCLRRRRIFCPIPLNEIGLVSSTLHRRFWQTGQRDVWRLRASSKLRGSELCGPAVGHRNSLSPCLHAQWTVAPSGPIWDSA